MDSPTPHPSTIGLGRINHHSPSLNATSAQNSQSWQRCQEALGGGWARSAHRRALKANAHRSLAHKGARYPRHAGLPGSPPPTGPLCGSSLLPCPSQAFLQEANGKVLAETLKRHIGKYPRPPAPTSSPSLSQNQLGSVSLRSLSFSTLG